MFQMTCDLHVEGDSVQLPPNRWINVGGSGERINEQFEEDAKMM